MIGLTSSSRGDFLSCQRQYLYKHVWRVEPASEETGEPLFIGKLWHEVLEARAKNVHFAWPTPATHTERERVLKVRAMYRAYCDKWGETEDSHLAEVEFSVPFRRGVRLLGKMDGLDGSTLVEHKTVSRITPEYVERLTFDGQLHIYALAMASCGRHVTNVRYDIVTRPGFTLQLEESEADFNERYAKACAANKNGKSSATRKLGETDEEFISRCAPTVECRREEFLLGDADRVAFAKELALLAKAIASKTWFYSYLRNDHNCYKWNRSCPYMALCRNNVSDAESALRFGFVPRPAHRELSPYVIAYKGVAKCFQ